MKCWTSIGLLVSLALSSVAQAATWKSPDGNLSFDLPSDGSLVEVKNPPAPAVAIWETRSGGGRLVFLSQPNAQNHALILPALEKGTREAFPGATITSSTETSQNGVPIFTIAASIKPGGYVQQTIVAFNHTLYKLMAAGQKPIATDPHFSVSFQSFKILDPAPSSPGKWSANDIARKVGIIVVALGFVAFAVYVLRKLFA